MAAEEMKDQTHLLQSGDHLKLLDEIDKLRSQGISHYVSLPQLIVCGDQSSGKSSVLEAISGISFPTKDTLCTRFATEVILRKANAISVSVRIVPSQTRSESECSRLSQFCEILADLKDFPDVVERAKTAMGISTTTSAFSNDVLRVEISGPDRPPLTIVDLPGLIHSENKVQSSADVTLVSEMVRGYMKNPRSIILAIISAKNDYANQIILKLAKEVDKSGYRTLGIITKPDTLSIGSESEAAFIDLARNEDVTFRLGWHALKNRSYETRDTSSEERNAAEEAFFSEGVWKDLPRSMVGIHHLQARLSKVLLNQIKAELPALVEDIEKGVAEATKKLGKLGEKRVTVDEQRLFLLRIGQSFQNLVKAAVDGTYIDPFFGELSSDSDDSRRLRAVVQNLNVDFAELMRTHGHRRRILDQRLFKTKEKSVPRDDFEVEIVGLLKRNRGRELPGMYNPLIVGEIFHQQSQPWEDKARSHIKIICEAVETFLEQVLAYLADTNTCSNLYRDVVGPLLSERAKEINVKLDEILIPFIRGHPITYNHYFTETIQDIRQKRLEKDVTERLRKLSPSLFDDDADANENIADTIGSNLKVSDLISALSSRNEGDMDKYAASEILLCMEAYYKVAMKVFVDNVAAQAVESCLLARLGEILSPTSILEMDASLIASIAGEPEESQVEREQLSRKLAVLQSGLDLCKRYASRPARKIADKDASTTKTNTDEQRLTPKPTPEPKVKEPQLSTSASNARPAMSPTPPPSKGATPSPAETKPNPVAEQKPSVPTVNGFAQNSEPGISSPFGQSPFFGHSSPFGQSAPFGQSGPFGQSSASTMPTASTTSLFGSSGSIGQGVGFGQSGGSGQSSMFGTAKNNQVKK